MKSNEQVLFLSLCDDQRAQVHDWHQLLKATSPNVLGMLFYHRMSATAYHVLKSQEMLSFVNREFRSAVRTAYRSACETNGSYLKCVAWVNRILSAQGIPFALLKGAILCGQYPKGCRTSNDIDVLIRSDHVTQVGDTLKKNGFEQGHIRSDRFLPATREEIISSRMMRGETVPFIKPVGLPGLEYLEIDLNFSIDYQNSGGSVVKSLLQKAEKKDVCGESLYTLCDADFFIHLCCHLYKEATTLPWIRMGRDMTLYKYRDLQMQLNRMTDEQTRKIFDRAKELSVEKICAFGVLQTSALLTVTNTLALEMSTLLLTDDASFLHAVVAPAEKRTYCYVEKDIRVRFFHENRIQLLGG